MNAERKRYILAIDSGTFESAYVLIEYQTLRPFLFDKIPNDEMIVMIRNICLGYDLEIAAIEKIASYGKPIGQETIDTAEWNGEFRRTLIDKGIHPMMIYRRQERMNLCESNTANDAMIRQALIDRFAYGVPNKGKGTKDNRGFFYGFRADIWQAFAVAVTAYDLSVRRRSNAEQH